MYHQRIQLLDDFGVRWPTFLEYQLLQKDEEEHIQSI